MSIKKNRVRKRAHPVDLMDLAALLADVSDSLAELEVTIAAKKPRMIRLQASVVKKDLTELKIHIPGVKVYLQDLQESIKRPRKDAVKETE